MGTLAHNVVRPINSTNAFIDARVVDRPKNHRVDGRTVVVNISGEPATVGEPPLRPLPAFSSTVLVDSAIERGEQVLLFRVRDESGIANIVDEPGWQLFADLLPGFPRDTKLFRGPRELVGTVELDQARALGEGTATGPRPFDVWANLWFAPVGTSCGIHDRHDFIEIHTQVYGYGRMQKFRSNDFRTLYEDQLMSPGHTPPVPFCVTGQGGGFTYPWHQYRADTACVWVAVEYHPRAPKG